jgi:hypothetical protein
VFAPTQVREKVKVVVTEPVVVREVLQEPVRIVVEPVRLPMVGKLAEIEKKVNSLGTLNLQEK